SAAIMRRWEHVHIPMLIRRLPLGARPGVIIFVKLATCLAVTLVAYYGLRWVLGPGHISSQTSGISTHWIKLAVPIGAGLMALFALRGALADVARQIRRLFERLKREGPVAACYEAGVSGYDLHRQITGLGVACAVIAPALTPRRPGQRIKTDRRDAAKLVRLFRAGELTAIHVLDESEEAVR